MSTTETYLRNDDSLRHLLLYAAENELQDIALGERCVSNCGSHVVSNLSNTAPPQDCDDLEPA